MEKKIYFLADSHLGVPTSEKSLERERILVSWLDKVSVDAGEIYLLGDIFDFWFEYSSVVPKGFVRLLGKLAEVADSGVRVHYFTGNHDMWAFGYFEKEMGLIMHRKPIEVVHHGKVLLIGHGDGLGPGDHGYKMLKKLFSSRLAQKLFSFLHPGFGTNLALYFSKKSRIANGQSDRIFLGKEKEALVNYCLDVLKSRHVDYFIFGHRHYPLDIEVAPGSRYINTGDWISQFSYAVLDQGVLSLKSYLNGE